MNPKWNYYLGGISTLAVISGSVLKILHINGGTVMLSMGLVLFFIFLANKRRVS
jgi:hypothetical protein